MSKYMIVNGQLREFSDDELMHWKYVKKTKKNGRWVYYYDESEKNRAKESLDKASALYFKAGINNQNAEIDLENAGRRMNTHINNPDRDGTKTAEIFEARDKAWDNYQKTHRAKYEAGKRYYAARTTYQKVLTKDLTKKKIAKGAVKVANFFSKLFSKKK